MKHWLAPTAAVLACFGAVESRGAPGRDVSSVGDPTDVVATVGDSPIFRSELDAVLRRAAAAGQLPVAPEDATGADPERRRFVEAMAIEQLVDANLLRSEIAREQITVGQLEVDGRLEQLKREVAARGMQWQRFVEQTGRSESTLREQIELEIGLDKLVRPKLTAAVIADGLEQHRREFDGTRLRVSHIVLRPDEALGPEGVAAAEAHATAIRREIVQGATTFAQAARQHSAAPSRARGGDIGWITREAPLLDAFSKEAFALPKGEVSKPLTTPFGVHLIQVTAIEPGKIGPEALRPKIESLLATNMLRETLARLRSSTPVSFGSGVAHFDPATPADGGVPRRVVVEGAVPRATSAARP